MMRMIERENTSADFHDRTKILFDLGTDSCTRRALSLTAKDGCIEVQLAKLLDGAEHARVKTQG